mgnify:CR=1 FL=1
MRASSFPQHRQIDDRRLGDDRLLGGHFSDRLEGARPDDVFAVTSVDVDTEEVIVAETALAETDLTESLVVLAPGLALVAAFGADLASGTDLRGLLARDVLFGFSTTVHSPTFVMPNFYRVSR